MPPSGAGRAKPACTGTNRCPSRKESSAALPGCSSRPLKVLCPSLSSSSSASGPSASLECHLRGVQGVPAVRTPLLCGQRTLRPTHLMYVRFSSSCAAERRSRYGSNGKNVSSGRRCRAAAVAASGSRPSTRCAAANTRAAVRPGMRSGLALLAGVSDARVTGNQGSVCDAPANVFVCDGGRTRAQRLQLVIEEPGSPQLVLSARYASASAGTLPGAAHRSSGSERR